MLIRHTLIHTTPTEPPSALFKPQMAPVPPPRPKNANQYSPNVAYYFNLFRDSSENELNHFVLSMQSKQSTRRIPPDFRKQWGVSDVILIANNAENIQLHVNRAVMATFSPVFEAMFFSDFQEKTKEKVDLDIEYDVLKEILQIIHSIDRNYGEFTNKVYSASMLAKLYRAGDKYDIPLIRDLCGQQFQQIKAREAFEVAIELELHDQKSEILKRMTFEDVEVFLQTKSDSLVLSPNDVAEIVNKCREHVQNQVRCTHCKATDVRPNNSYTSGSQKGYDCNKCRNIFIVYK